jgi:hypothetical protein
MQLERSTQMAHKSEDAKARAEAQFKRREQQSREAEEVRADNLSKSRAVDEKTARLKGLRLAKEVADKEAAARTQREPVKKKTRKAT